MGPKEAGSGKISLALPLRLIVITPHPVLSEINCELLRLDSGQEQESQRSQTSVPGVWGSELEDCSPSSVRSLKRVLSSGGYRKSV